MTAKVAKIMILEKVGGYSSYVFTVEKVHLKAENFREKNLKKAYQIQCFPPLEGLFVKDKNLYKPFSVNWYERYVFGDEKNVRKFSYSRSFKVIPRVTALCNKIFFLLSKEKCGNCFKKYIKQLPNIQLSSRGDAYMLRAGAAVELQRLPYKITLEWKKYLMQQYGSLVEGLSTPYLRYLPVETLINLQGALYLAQLKTLLPAPNPLAQLLPFLKPKAYELRSEDYTSLLSYVKLFEGYIAAGKEREFFAAIKGQAGDKYLSHCYAMQNGHFIVAEGSGPIETLGKVYSMLGFILYNTPRQDFHKLFNLSDYVYLEGSAWTTGLELEKLRLSNFAGVKVKSNSFYSRLHLEQQAVILGFSLPFGACATPVFYKAYNNFKRNF